MNWRTITLDRAFMFLMALIISICSFMFASLGCYYAYLQATVRTDFIVMVVLAVVIVAILNVLLFSKTKEILLSKGIV